MDEGYNVDSDGSDESEVREDSSADESQEALEDEHEEEDDKEESEEAARGRSLDTVHYSHRNQSSKITLYTYRYIVHTYIFELT